ncbi:hypothetical protein EJ03DRAFT_352766 [Teratosphaeria nubilosa]|uniref:Uncharacterized protein n=1 Tax=Teratosphaeria nubilosa TaxID=161662 RepID=A0A6G1L4F9_9PEZI|nr:hypothetical protein EJ03DRAFT_352766 [Teratosphaeria nubilosa]
MAETIKSALGLDSKTQEGQEPVAGQQGAGDAFEPYDQGNREGDGNLGGNAPQLTDPEKVTGEAEAADSTTPSGKSEAPALHEASAVPTAAETFTKETTPIPSSATHTSSKAVIGSPEWPRTGIPGYNKQEVHEPAGRAAAGNVSDKNVTENTQAVNGLPSDHVGQEAPSGHATAEDKINKSTNANAIASTDPSATTSPSSHTGKDQEEAAQDAGLLGGVTGAAAGMFTKLNPFAPSSNINDAILKGTQHTARSSSATLPPTTTHQHPMSTSPTASSAAAATPSVTVHEPPGDTSSQTPSMTAEEKRNGKMPDRSDSISTQHTEQQQHQRRKSYIPTSSVNEGRIPIAGGIPLGQGEMVARRKSTAVVPSVPSVPEGESVRVNDGAGERKEKEARGAEGKPPARKSSVLGRMRSRLGRKRRE